MAPWTNISSSRSSGSLCRIAFICLMESSLASIMRFTPCSVPEQRRLGIQSVRLSTQVQRHIRHAFTRHPYHAGVIDDKRIGAGSPDGCQQFLSKSLRSSSRANALQATYTLAFLPWAIFAARQKLLWRKVIGIIPQAHALRPKIYRVRTVIDGRGQPFHISGRSQKLRHCYLHQLFL